jgi:hypothetical protein
MRTFMICTAWISFCEQIKKNEMRCSIQGDRRGKYRVEVGKYE